ncbi:MAG: hypothetical protein ACYCOU_05735 [Sulfobacillus sp.]
MSLSHSALVVVRYLILAALVFGATTYIPHTPLEMNDRLVITAVVVILFAILNLLSLIFPPLRNFLCGCEPVPQPAAPTGCPHPSSNEAK